MSRFASGLRGLAPFVMAGDGGVDLLPDLLHGLEEEGVAAVEVGLPFGDPIADGPELQAAAARALAAGADLDGVLARVADYRSAGGGLPLALMSYLNPLLRPGFAAACRAVRDAGCDALVVPDAPLDAAPALTSTVADTGLDVVGFVAPTTPPARAAAVARASTAFVYVVGRVGVTGAATRLDADLDVLLASVRSAASVPVALGFGLRDALTVAAALERADLAIVGSALVQHVHRAAESGEDRVAAARSFVRSLMAPTRR